LGGMSYYSRYIAITQDGCAMLELSPAKGGDVRFDEPTN
jgi:hypothetical protein